MPGSHFRRLIPALTFAVAALLAAAPAPAQTPADVQRAQGEAQRILQEEQQRELQRRRDLEERARPPQGQALPPAPAPPATPAEPERCFTIRSITLDGATRLSPSDTRPYTEPLIGRCVGLAAINELVQNLTNLYVSRGYTTTRVYIPEQDLASGELKLLVLEGLVERIELKGSGLSIATAFPGLAGQVFNLRDFEQGLDQANRLRSNSATLDIAPGTVAGASVVQITNEPTRRWSLGAAVDNTGSVSTGRNQASVTYGLDDLLGLNDYLNLSLRANPDYHPRDRMSRSVSVFYSIPYGRWLLSLSGSNFAYASLVQGQVTTFRSSGTSETRSLKLERNVYRDQFVKASVSGNLTLKDNRNFLNDQALATSSRKLTVFDLAGNLSVNAWGGLWSFDLAHSRGLKAFGAETDTAGQSDLLPKAQFSKFTYGASLTRPFEALGTPLQWQTSVSGQKASDVLYGTEQFSAGGPFSVRGFRTLSLSGDSGWWWRNELGTAVPLSKLLGDWAGALRPFVGYDIGHVEGKNGLPGGTLAGATVGMTWNAAPVGVSWSYSRPTRTPPQFAGVRDKYIYLRLSADF